MRSRVEAYFKLCVKNLRDSIPKAIGYNLVQSIQDNMEMYLYKALYDNKEIVEVLNEPEGIKRKRIELNRQIKKKLKSYYKWLERKNLELLYKDERLNVHKKRCEQYWCIESD